MRVLPFAGVGGAVAPLQRPAALVRIGFSFFARREPSKRKEGISHRRWTTFAPFPKGAAANCAHSLVALCMQWELSRNQQRSGNANDATGAAEREDEARSRVRDQRLFFLLLLFLRLALKYLHFSLPSLSQPVLTAHAHAGAPLLPREGTLLRGSSALLVGVIVLLLVRCFGVCRLHLLCCRCPGRRRRRFDGVAVPPPDDRLHRRRRHGFRRRRRPPDHQPRSRGVQDQAHEAPRRRLRLFRGRPLVEDGRPRRRLRRAARGARREGTPSDGRRPSIRGIPGRRVHWRQRRLQRQHGGILPGAQGQRRGESFFVEVFFHFLFFFLVIFARSLGFFFSLTSLPKKQKNATFSGRLRLRRPPFLPSPRGRLLLGRRGELRRQPVPLRASVPGGARGAAAPARRAARAIRRCLRTRLVRVRRQRLARGDGPRLPRVAVQAARRLPRRADRRGDPQPDPPSECFLFFFEFFFSRVIFFFSHFFCFF